jgi:hypothetical protein
MGEGEAHAIWVRRRRFTDRADKRPSRRNSSNRPPAAIFGQINASGRLFVGADTSATKAAGAIFAEPALAREPRSGFQSSASCLDIRRPRLGALRHTLEGPYRRFGIERSRSQGVDRRRQDKSAAIPLAQMIGWLEGFWHPAQTDDRGRPVAFREDRKRRLQSSWPFLSSAPSQILAFAERVWRFVHGRSCPRSSGHPATTAICAFETFEATSRIDMRAVTEP